MPTGRWIGVWMTLALGVWGGSGCAPDLSMTLRIEDRELETLGEPLSPTVLFRNEGSRPLLLPVGLIEARRNLALVIYRRWRGYPRWYDVSTEVYREPPPPPLPPQPPLAASAHDPLPPYRLDAAKEADGPSWALSRPAVVRLEPGESYRFEFPPMPAALFVKAGPDAPQIGIWAVRVFFNARYPEDGLERIRPDVRERLWRGVVRSNAVAISVAERVEDGEEFGF